MTLEEDIKRTEYMLEHSFSKSKKIYYGLILQMLIDTYNDTHEDIISRNLGGNLEAIIDKNLSNCLYKSIKDIVEPPYINFINCLTRNALRCFKGKNVIQQYPKKEYNLNQAKDLILDFFNKFDEKLYFIIKDALSSEHLFIVDKPEEEEYNSPNGYVYHNYCFKNSYIVIYNHGKLSIEVIDCIAHELGHVINYNFAHNKPNFDRITLYNNLVETPSCIFEKLFLDYLISININPYEVEQTNTNNLFLLKNDLKDLKLINRVIDKIPLIEEPDIELIYDLLGDEGVQYSEIFDVPDLPYKYSYGRLLSIYYSKLYKKDPEKTKKSIYDFIKCIGIMDDFDMLSSFGIKQDEFIKCDYLREEIKNNQKIYKI